MNIVSSPDATGAVSVSEDFAYNYPMSLDLRPNSPLHNKIVTEVNRRAMESHSVMSRRHPTWKLIDRTLTAYVPPDKEEEDIKYDDSRKPTSIVVPYSYATLETLLTYLVSSLLNDPIFQYSGVSPEDMVGATMMELVVAQQCRRAKVALALHTMFRDNLAYGIGPVAPIWTKEWGKKTVLQEQGFMSSIFSRFINMGQRRSNVEAVLYEGNTLMNIDPYTYLPDPNVPAHAVGKGAYVGWVDQSNVFAMLEMEKNDGENIFNCKYLRTMGSCQSAYGSKREQMNQGRDKNYGSDLSKPCDTVYMYVNLIPREWGLAARDYPEKWFFGVTADKLVTMCKPLGLNHNKYPVAVCASESDGYSTSPISRMEVIYGLQTTLDWLFSSHIANVRKAINDMLIVDPSLININDLKDPKPGKLVRTRRAAWGKGIEGAVKQLDITDITQGHIKDSSFIVDLIKQVSASNDVVMGINRNTSDRITAQEVRDTSAGALSRLGRMARLISLQAMHEISYMFASHTQQLMSQTLYGEIVGKYRETIPAERQIKGRVKITPYDLIIDYDLVHKDITQGSDMQVWTQLFQSISQNDILINRFNVVNIFKHIARMSGAKDLDDFENPQAPQQIPNVQGQVMPDEQVAREVEKGNLIPAGGGQ